MFTIHTLFEGYFENLMTNQKVDEFYMQQALDQARLAARQGEVPVGAVLVLEGEVIAATHNQPIVQHDPTAHAEVMVLRQAAENIQNYRLTNSTLYVTLEPCAMCLGAMQHARVARCVFGASDPKTGVLGGCEDLLAGKWALHKMQVEGGILASECGALIKDFFAARRL